MSIKQLNDIMMSTFDIDVSKVCSYSFKVNGLTYKKLRDCLYILGKIVYESEKEQIYLTNIKGGFFHLNIVIAGFQLTNTTLYISLYAREGIIEQHTNEGVINEIRKQFKDVIKEA